MGNMLLMAILLLIENKSFIFPLKTRQEGVHLPVGGIFIGRVGVGLGLMA